MVLAKKYMKMFVGLNSCTIWARQAGLCYLEIRNLYLAKKTLQPAVFLQGYQQMSKLTTVNVPIQFQFVHPTTSN